MKLSSAFLLSAMLLIGVGFASAQDRDSRWNNGAVYQTVQWNNNNNNSEYQRGVQDGINSGRSDANGGKVADLNNHPYYRNSNNQAYREGFAQGYRETYSQMRGSNGRNNGYYGNNGTYNNGAYNNGRNANGYYDREGHFHPYDKDHDRDHDHDQYRDHDHDHDRDDH